MNFELEHPYVSETNGGYTVRVGNLLIHGGLVKCTGSLTLDSPKQAARNYRGREYVNEMSLCTNVTTMVSTLDDLVSSCVCLFFVFVLSIPILMFGD